MYIYKIVNKSNGKCYIGQSIQNNNKRLYQHKYKLNKGIHSNHHLQSAWSFYGSDVFSFEKIAFTDTELELDELEKQYINTYKSNNRDFGYNIFDGGHHMHNVPNDVRKKIGNANRGNSHTSFQKNKWAKEKRTNNYADEIVSPEGKTYSVKNIREFCKIHDIDKANLMKVLQGKSYHVKGWRLSSTPIEFCNRGYVSFHVQSKFKRKKLLNSDGEIYIIDKPLSVFCKEHNIVITKIRNVLSGKQKQHRGWVLFDENQNTIKENDIN